MTNEELRIIRRFCGAILELREHQPHKNCVKRAAAQLNLGSLPETMREPIVQSIIYNTLSHKEYPFELLQRKYGLAVSHGEFSALKTAFCVALAQECGFTPAQGSERRWSKKDVLDMLFTIANEANECITTEKGTFNHQVAGVALKAIDQAVKLAGIGEEQSDRTLEITFEDDSEALGA